MPDDAKPATTRLPAEVYEDLAFCGKYMIERELGVGGSGVVVGARHRELDERVAIKFLLPGPQSSASVARFRREARAATRIKNEHVVRIFDVSATETGIPYIVMEYLDGIDLERMLLQSPHHQLPIRDAVEFVLQACEVLAECHGMGIVHRDLKPSNLFCVHGADGLPVIKVLDFGISKLGSTTTDQVVTGEHTIVGSPRYMSPEQFDSSAGVDLRTDIWALGVILYELITGTAPFADDSLMKIWRRVESQVPPSLEALRRDAPQQLTPIVRKCLEKEPGKRYANVAEFAKALLPFGPERARISVERIVRIVEAPGVTTGALDLRPISEPGQSSEVPTIESPQPDLRTVRETRLPLRRLGPALGALTVVAVIGGSLGLPESPRLGNVMRRPSLPRSLTAHAAAGREPPRSRAPDAGARAEARAATNATRRASAVVPRRSRTDVDAAVDTRPRSDPAATAELPAAPLTAPPVPAGNAAAQPTRSAGAPSAAQPTSSAAPSASRFLMEIVEQRKPKHTGN